jgi:hypothetical protein
VTNPVVIASDINIFMSHKGRTVEIHSLAEEHIQVITKTEQEVSPINTAMKAPAALCSVQKLISYEGTRTL